MTHALKVNWIDRGREPQCEPNPDYPDGVDLDTSFGASSSCFTELPYPAKRCGYYLVVCDRCQQSVLITTAGRRDDPRSVKLACMDRTKQ